MFKQYTCQSCGGVAHPATGCQYSETAIVCGPCIRTAWAWVAEFTSRPKKLSKQERGRNARLVYFYEAAGRNRPIDNGV